MPRIVTRKVRKAAVCLYLDRAVSYMETKQKDSYTVSPDEFARCLNRSVPTDEVYKHNTYSRIGYRVSLETIESLLWDAVRKYGHNVTVENTGTAVLIRK